MLSNIITNVKLLNLPVLSESNHHVLKELVKVVLQLVLGHGASGRVAGVLVGIHHDHCLGKVGFDVFSGAAVAMATGPNFEVEGAVDLVLFCAVNGGQVVCGVAVCEISFWSMPWRAFERTPKLTSHFDFSWGLSSIRRKMDSEEFRDLTYLLDFLKALYKWNYMHLLEKDYEWILRERATFNFASLSMMR